MTLENTAYVYHNTSSNLLDGKTIKYYDQAKTPYRRILASEQVAFSDKVHLTNLYVQLNPVTLRQRIDLNIGKLWKIIK